MITEGTRRWGWPLLACAVLLSCGALVAFLVAGASRGAEDNSLCTAEQAPPAAPSPSVSAGVPSPTGQTSPHPFVPVAVPTPTVRITDKGGQNPSGPPPFLIRFGGTELEIAPVTFCYSATPGLGLCVDGWDKDPASIGSVGEFFVFVPVPEFDRLDVSLTTFTDLPSGSFGAGVGTENLGGNWWRVRPSGPAGDYRISIFATGSGGGGDMIADVRWRSAAPS